LIGDGIEQNVGVAKTRKGFDQRLNRFTPDAQIVFLLARLKLDGGNNCVHGFPVLRDSCCVIRNGTQDESRSTNHAARITHRGNSFLKKPYE
jgi:hypothetical protein